MARPPRQRHRWSRRAVLLLLLLVVLLSACRNGTVPADTADDAGPSTAAAESTTTVPRYAVRNGAIHTRAVLPSVDVWAWIGQPRHLESTKRITVPLRFQAEEPVLVVSMAVRAPHFEPLPPEAKDSLLHPGRKVDLQVDLGPARCGALDDADPEVQLVLQVGSAAPADVAVPVPTWLLDELREQECTLAEVLDAVDVRFGDFTAPDGVALATELVLERGTGRQRIVLEEIAGSVVLDLRPRRTGTPVATLRPGDDVVRVPVDVTATRCDAHAMAASQRSFVFPAWVTVGDSPAVFVELRPAPDLEAAMHSALAACVAEGA